MNDGLQVERLRHEQQLREVDQIAPRGDPGAAQLITLAGLYYDDNVLKMDKATPVQSAVVLGSPVVRPIGLISGPGGVDGAVRTGRLINGRWTTQTTFCPCGPCHPQHGLDLNIDFVQAVGNPGDLFGTPASWTHGLASATIPLSFAVSAGVSVNTGGSLPYAGPYSWANEIYTNPLTLLGNPFLTYDAGTTTWSHFVMGAGYDGLYYGDAYYWDRHVFRLTCNKSGFDLVHTIATCLYTIGYGTSGGTGEPRIDTFVNYGYNTHRRGIVRRCKPTMRIEFGDILSWDSFYYRYDYKFGNPGTDPYGQGPAVHADGVTYAGLSPPFGVYSIVVEGS